MKLAIKFVANFVEKLRGCYKKWRHRK